MVARKVLLAVTSVLILAIIVFGAWLVSASVPPKRATERYIHALASGDAETALQYSSGNAAFAALHLKESGVTAKVEDVSCSVAALGRGWARVLATVELTLQNGSADVGWYSVDAVRIGQDWKVVSFREAEPEFARVSLYMNRAGVEAVRRVFQGYLDALATGEWPGAAKYLAGPARRSQEMSTAVLGKGAIIGKVEGLNAEPVWARGKEAVIRFEYTVDGRNVSVLAFFYRTAQGWKITKIAQS